MDLLTSWLLFPLVLLVLATGCGLLLENIVGRQFSNALVPTIGFAVLLVAAYFTTATNGTAELTIPVVLALAVAGFALSPPWHRLPFDGWALGAAAGVVVAYAAPVVLSGDSTFTGYIKLDDTSTWLAFTDRVMEHGRSVDGLAPSTYEATLAVNLGRGYPWGVFPPLGIGAALTDQDALWVFQPYLAFLAAMLSLAIYSIASTTIESRPLRALASFISAQAALLFAYALWGGIKELAAAWLLALVAAVAFQGLRSNAHSTSFRELASGVLPLAVASAAMLAVLSLGGALWLAPVLLPAVGLLYYVRGRSFAFRSAGVFCLLGALLTLPSLLTADSFLKPYGDDLQSQPLGNLIEPLSPLQTVGIWPVGDFRLDPANLDAAHVLIAVALLAGAVGMWWAYRRRAWEALLYLTGAIGSAVVVAIAGTPWVDAKAFAIASPALVLAALIGAAAVLSRRRVVEAAVLAAAISGGVLWSNVLAYEEVILAPHDRFAELEHVSKQIEGEGPTLMTEYEPYGVRHFLRDADPEGASELRRRPVTLTNGQVLDKLEFADLDRFRLESILVYRTLVMRRSPVASRPPSPYRLAWSGRYYELWQRPDVYSEIVAHLPLGGRLRPGARPRCPDVLRLARAAGKGGTLATVRRLNPYVVSLARLPRPANWPRSSDPLSPNAITPEGAGAAVATVRVTEPDRYQLWVGEGFRRRVDVLVDGRQVASGRHRISHNSQYQPMGEVRLTRGTHTVEVEYGEQDLHPGSHGFAFPLGPLAVSRETDDRPVTFVEPSRASSLCGQTLDWIEAIGAVRR